MVVLEERAMNAPLDGIWFFIIVFELALYGAFDGADLGIGVLSLFARDEKQRGIMIESISPLWYANETWLVVAGASLFGAFPLAYAIVLNALYIPVMIMLLGLIFRAVSLEFGPLSRNRGAWEKSFAVGSAVAIVGEACILGGVLSGIKNDGEVFTGGTWDWAHPLTAFVIIGFLFGFTMMGSAFLVMKTEGATQRKNYFLFRVASTSAFIMFILTMVTIPFLHEFFVEQWLSVPNIYYLVLFAVVVCASFALLLVLSSSGRLERAPYIMSIVIFALALGGVSVGIFPFIVPPSITVESAASPRQTLLFMLFGVGLLVPVILIYNMYMHGVFKGKVRE
jgi:cytochrome d ubiquinol oxidase subunit II